MPLLRSTPGVLLLVVTVVASMSGCTPPDDQRQPDSGEQSRPPRPGPTRPDGQQPNIVFILTDDMDSSLVQYMPRVQEMQRHGVSFANYTVTDSLCCPSRASTLTGKFPHNTGVFTNTPPDGGFDVFHNSGQERSTIGTQLQQAGYRTGFMGKYLNGYQPQDKQGGSRPYVPAGWNEWAVTGNGYPEYDYTLNENGTLTSHGDRPRDYLTDVLADKGNKFIRDNAEAGTPFFLEVAPFVPHSPSTPAPRHKREFPGLRAPRDPAFAETDLSDKPGWLRGTPPLSGKQRAKIDHNYRKRAQSLQAVDDMLGRFQDTLRATGQASNTHIVFTSDNGFHMGQHGLNQGKQTAFDTDVAVPLIATGPGVPAGHVVREPIENIDLAPTFAELAGTAPTTRPDGHSFLAPLTGQPAADWKTAALIEHHGPNRQPGDPDRPRKNGGNPPTYRALRTPEETYVEYITGEREYYDRRSDPDQLTNSYASLPTDKRATLHDTLARLGDCHGTEACWAAAHGPT